MVLEKILESLLNCKEIKPVNPKGNQPWIFIGRTDAEAETPILWPPDAKSWLIWKDLDAGKDWRWVEKGMTGDKMAEWHHQFSGHKFEQILGDSEPQVSLACCSSWGLKVSDTTEWLNWTELNWYLFGASQVGLVVKKTYLPNTGDIRDAASNCGSGRSPGFGIATHSSILVWRIPWTEEPGRLQSIALKLVGTNLAHTHIPL